MCLWPNINDLPEVKPLWKVPVSYQDGYNAGFKDGRAEQARLLQKCHDIFAEHSCNIHPIQMQALVDIMTEIEAALDAVKPEGK